MPIPSVYISEHAFLQLLVSCAELYPDDREKSRRTRDVGECFGYIFGTQAMQGSRPVCRVEFVVPCQRVSRRSRDSVTPNKNAEERIMSILDPFPGLDLLGAFHSHLAGSGRETLSIQDMVLPSEEDDDSWAHWWDDSRKGDMALELIVGLKELRINGSKATTQNVNCLEGRWGRFAYAVGAWFATRKRAASNPEVILQPVHWLMCPAAFGFTRDDFKMMTR